MFSDGAVESSTVLMLDHLNRLVTVCFTATNRAFITVAIRVVGWKAQIPRRSRLVRPTTRATTVNGPIEGATRGKRGRTEVPPHQRAKTASSWRRLVI